MLHVNIIIEKFQDSWQNLLSRFSVNNITYYQYLEECDRENHFYLECDICFKKIHIDCDCITDLFSHIHDRHKFLPNEKNIVISGVCKNCRDKERK